MKRALWLGVALASAATCATHGFVLVSGESMSPALRMGDVCVYRRNAPVEVGDVVVYRRADGARVVHRVIGVGQRGELRTKGDASTLADRDVVPAHDVAGPVIVRVPMAVMRAN